MANYTFTKDKNFILFQNDVNKIYKFDINTGLFYGLRGTPIKSFPSGFSTWLEDNFKESNVLRLMYYIKVHPYTYHYNDSFKASLYSDFAELFKTVDRLTSIGYTTYPWGNEFTPENLNFVRENFKVFSKYYNEDKETFKISTFREEYEKVLWTKKHKLVPDEHLTERTIDALFSRRAFYNEKNIPYAIYYLKRGLIDWYNNDAWDACRKMEDYFDMCEKLGCTPEKEDFFRAYINTRRTYLLSKEKIDTKAIQENLAKHPALSFENNLFQIIIPQTVEDFRAEGTAMRNCVYSIYMGKVVKGETNVVFVRKKSDPNTSYITCEVNNHGYIYQYLASCNRAVSDADALAFKNQYANHLRTNWQ